MSTEEDARRAFALPALPPGAELGDGIELAWLDPADADDRALLIRAAHPGSPAGRRWATVLVAAVQGHRPRESRP